MEQSETQKEIFMKTEGDRWFARNARPNYSDDDDTIVKVLRSIELAPTRVLEIGCSNGHRLDLIRKAFNSKCCGVDPSATAIEDGKRKFPDISLQVGTADSLNFEDHAFDAVVFGFCLYLCDRSDLFKIAFEADRCLQNEGTVIIKDFYATFPFRNKYSHHHGVYSYKMDYSRLFTWNPAYIEVAKIVSSHCGFPLRDVPDERIAVIVIRKNQQYAYLEEPFKQPQS
jgi:ubiquinone/menaquinone biosynthesis C-methylase UbiE